MAEQEIREPGPTYVTSDTVVTEQTIERALDALRIAPYFDRFLEERDRRLSSELGRLEAAIRQNTERIDWLAEEMDRRISELTEEMDRRFANVDRRFSELSLIHI